MVTIDDTGYEPKWFIVVYSGGMGNIRCGPARTPQHAWRKFDAAMVRYYGSEAQISEGYAAHSPALCAATTRAAAYSADISSVYFAGNEKHEHQYTDDVRDITPRLARKGLAWHCGDEYDAMYENDD